MFCYFNIDDFSAITVKCDPLDMAELMERYLAIGEPFNGDKRYWINVQTDSDLNDEQIKQLVRDSYEIVKAKHKKHG